MTTRTSEIRYGNRVRLKHDHTATGTVDEIYDGESGKLASVVWDISGCIGDGPLENLELIEDLPLVLWDDVIRK